MTRFMRVIHVFLFRWGGKDVDGPDTGFRRCRQAGPWRERRWL